MRDAIFSAIIYGPFEQVLSLLKENPERVSFRENNKTPLHFAVTFDQKDMVEALVLNGANVNSADESGRAPLHVAAERGRKEIVAILLSNKAVANLKDNEGRTPLHYAISKGRRDIYEVLIAVGAEVNARANNGMTPLHVAAQGGHKEIAEMLLRSAADIEAKTYEDGFSPLHFAAGLGHYGVLNLLLERKSDIRALTKGGVTAEQLATVRGHNLEANLLKRRAEKLQDEITRETRRITIAELRARAITASAATQANDGTAFRPLSSWPLQEVVQILEASIQGEAGVATIENTLKAHPELAYYRFPEQIRLVPDTNISNWTFLHWAARRWHWYAAAILLAAKADVNARTNLGCSPLHVACSDEKLFYTDHDSNIMDLLLACGADVNLTDIDGRSPLHAAAEHCLTGAVGQLLAHNATVNAKDRNGWTPLHYAVLNSFKHGDIFGNNSRSTIDLLLANSADVNAATLSGDTPLELALEYGYKDIADLLRSHGGKDRTGGDPSPPWPTAKKAPPEKRRELQIVDLEMLAVFARRGRCLVCGSLSWSCDNDFAKYRNTMYEQKACAGWQTETFDCSHDVLHYWPFDGTYSTPYGRLADAFLQKGCKVEEALGRMYFNVLNPWIISVPATMSGE